MEDLAAKLTELLGSSAGDESLRHTLQQAAAALGAAMDAPSPSAPAAERPDAGGTALASLSSLLPLLGQLDGEDDNTVLLRALRPYLQEDRRRRLDDAVKILKLMKVLPLLMKGEE